MKGDFSWFNYQPLNNFTGVLEQQGRTRLDSDGLAAEEIARGLRTLMGRDTFGPGRVAVPAEESSSFRITNAITDGTNVNITYNAGRAWIEGIPLLSGAQITAPATYLPPPFQDEVGPESINNDIRDAVVLEVWEDSISAFQDTTLLEPALGGVDTTERVKVCHRLRLRRLAEDETCATIDLRDDPNSIGRLSVTPSPSIVIAGDCPVEAGGGYSGDGHHLFCIEVASPRGAGPRFVWSRYGGGLVGRGRLDAIANAITVTHNRSMIDAANVSGMTLQALVPEGETGSWEVVYEATVSMNDGTLAVTDPIGTWPAAAGEHAFFRLWDGVEEVDDFTSPTELVDGIRLDFTVPDGQNYRIGDRWLFQARTAGTDFDPATWPQNALPQAIRYHRAPLGILNWTSTPPVELASAQIDDCRDSFPPLTNPCPCCTITVGDGIQTHGDEDSIEAAIDRLPNAGGKICLLPGLHQTNAIIRDRANIRIIGCGKDTRVIPRPRQRNSPIFHVVDSECISLLNMEIISLGGVGILGESSDDNALRQFTIEGNNIVACIRAIQIEGGSDIIVAKNRIRMLDKPGAGVAVYLAADDSRIEDNDIGVVPAGVTPQPPERPEDDDGPDDPNDPCADEQTIYSNYGFLVGFVNFVFGFTLTSIVPPPYRALGGIQIGAGSERIGVLDNRILGGAGNGITLGGSHIPETPGEVNGPLTQSISIGRSVLGLTGTVVDPDGNPANGVTLRLRGPGGPVRTITTNAVGEFEVQATGIEGTHVFESVTPAVGVDEVDVIQVVNLGAGSIMYLRIDLNRQRENADERLGFLYSVRIEDNDISAMGLNGIGIPPALTVLEEESSEPPVRVPLTDVVIDAPSEISPSPAATGNDERFLRARAAAVNPLLALFGNPLIDLTILNNRIHGNLATPFSSPMREAARLTGFGGISLGLCEGVTIIANRIEANGLRHIDPVCGIFVLFGEQVEITDNLIRDNGPYLSIDADVVEGQRGGIAGIFTSIGLDDFNNLDNTSPLPTKPALRIHDNVVQQPMGRSLTLLVAGPISIVANHLSAERSAFDRGGRLAGSVLLMSMSGVSGLPSGGCLIASNQITLGPQSNAFMAVALAAAEDISLDGNQIDANQAGTIINNATLTLNTLIFANTLRAIGNRFREPDAATDLAYQISLLSMSTRMNTTTVNQGDHCIFAFDQGTPQHLVDTNNLEFNDGPCNRLRSAAAGASLNPTMGMVGIQNLDFVSAMEPPEGPGAVYATELNPALETLNEYQSSRLLEAAEHKAVNAALLGNEVARLEAKPNVRVDILEASRVRLATINRDVGRIRAASEIVATKPEKPNDDEAIVLQGRVTDDLGNGLGLVQLTLADARGRTIDLIQPVQSDSKGGYVISIDASQFLEMKEPLKGGATIIAEAQGKDIKPIVSKVFTINKRSVLIPDIKITLSSNAQPVRPYPFRKEPIAQAIRRPVLTPALRRGVTAGRISSLVRASRIKGGVE